MLQRLHFMAFLLALVTICAILGAHVWSPNEARDAPTTPRHIDNVNIIPPLSPSIIYRVVANTCALALQEISTRNDRPKLATGAATSWSSPPQSQCTGFHGLIASVQYHLLGLSRHDGLCAVSRVDSVLLPLQSNCYNETPQALNFLLKSAKTGASNAFHHAVGNFSSQLYTTFLLISEWALLFLACAFVFAFQRARTQDRRIRQSSAVRIKANPLLHRWLLPVLLLCAVDSLSIYPVGVEASCNVIAPDHGTMGNCTTPMASGASCSFGCSVGYALSETPQQTLCNTTNSLVQQTCGLCPAGTTLTWDPSSLVKLVGTGVAPISGQGRSTAISADGNTMAVGGYYNGIMGATWIFIRNGGGSWTQQGEKLVGTGAVGSASQGSSVSLSSDGNTLAVGGPYDNNYAGATWIFNRNTTTGSWTQQGFKLVGTGAATSMSYVFQGSSVSLSSDGNTLAVGGSYDNNYAGATWIFSRNGSGTWMQQGAKLVGTGAVGRAYQGQSVSLSSDGSTLAVGGHGDNDGAGATWIFNRNTTTGKWSQQGTKLVGTGAVGSAYQGQSVSLSLDGNRLAVGGRGDNDGAGATWIFNRNTATGSWTQGSKLVGIGAIGTSWQGTSVSLSSDGNTLAVGGYADNNYAGATWIFTRDDSGTWTQQGSKLVGTGAVGSAFQGQSVALSSDGNTLAVGGYSDNIYAGATWIFTRDTTSGSWTQQGAKLVGTGAVGSAAQGSSVSLSSDGNTLAVGGPNDNSPAGATWIFTRDDSGSWTQQGSKLTHFYWQIDGVYQGTSVSLSSDANTLAVGGSATWIFTRDGSGSWTQQGNELAVVATVSLSSDGNTLAGRGADGVTWVFTRDSTSGSWTQQGPLVGTGGVGYASEQLLSLSSDGNTLAVGGWYDNNGAGATWIFSRNGSGTWMQQGAKLVGTGAVGSAFQGSSVSLSSDGTTLAVGGYYDNNSEGATWVGTIQGSCPLCPSGYACLGGSTVPAMCSTGTYCPSGSNAISTCMAGFYCPTSSTKIPCPNGTFNALAGQIAATSCTSCPPGRYGILSAQNSSSSCMPCPLGSFCSDGISIANCASGQYCPTGSVEASPCPMGQFCANSSTIEVCPAGSWSNRTGLTSSSECTLCNPGTFGILPNQTSAIEACQPCPVNSFCIGGTNITSSASLCSINIPSRADVGNCSGLVLPSGGSCILRPAVGYALETGSLILSCTLGQLSPYPTFVQSFSPRPPEIIFVTPPTTFTVGSGSLLEILATPSNTTINSSTLQYTWSFISSAAQAAGFSATTLPPSSSPLLQLDPSLLLPDTMYNITLRVVDTNPLHLDSNGVALSSMISTVIHVLPAAAQQVQTGAGMDPCRSNPSFQCMNGGHCVATQITPDSSTYSLTCACPTQPVQFFGANCGFALLECPNGNALYARGTDITLYGVGFNTLRRIAVSGRVVSFERDSAVNTTLDWKEVLNRWPNYANQVQRVRFMAPSLETINFTSPSRMLFSSSEAVNPPAAYKMLTLSSLLLADGSGSGKLLEANFSNLLYYSSSTCRDEGQWKEDGAGGCLPCPQGAFCPGGGRAWPLPGYWSWSEYQAPTKCIVAEACPGYINMAGSDQTAFANTQTCATGYEFTRCASCSSGYYQLNSRCYYCGSSVDQSSTIAATVIVSVVVMTLLAIVVSTQSSARLSQAIQIFSLLQGAAAIGVAGAQNSPYFGKELHEAMTYVNFSQYNFIHSSGKMKH